MNQQSIDRRISRCEKKITAADEEAKFYETAINHHMKRAEHLFHIASKVANYKKTADQMADHPLATIVQIDLTQSYLQSPTYFRACHGLARDETSKMARWHISQQEGAKKLKTFYDRKINYLKEKFAVLKIQKDYEQQPVA